jgi:hypothetical protein
MSEEEIKPKQIPGKPIDWKEIPEIKDDLAVYEHNRGLLDEGQGSKMSVNKTPNTADWFRPEVGKHLELKVTVNDTDLAQLTLMSGWSKNCRIPGFDITNIVVNPEGESLLRNADMLRQMADDLERQAATTRSVLE